MAAAAGVALLVPACASEGSSPERQDPAPSSPVTDAARPLGPGTYSMTTHTGVTVTADVPVPAADPRVADLERLRAAAKAPRATYVLVRLDNRAGEHDVVAAHLTVETTQGEAVTLRPVAARGREPGLLAVLVRRGADPREAQRLRVRLADAERVAIGRRSATVYASLDPLPVEEITEVALPIEERGPEYNLFKQ